MGKIKENITRFLALVLFIVLVMPQRAYAWEAHLNQDWDIEIYTVDKKGTSKIYYKTDGVDITRCSYNPTSQEIHSANQSFDWRLDNAKEELIDGTYYNTWTISMNDVIAGASAIDPEWGNEIKNAVDGTGPAVYIKLDCIMYIINDNEHAIMGPYRNRPVDNGGKNPTGINEHGNEIQYAYGWRNPNGLKTHYNHYLLIGNGQPVPPVTLADEMVASDYTMDHYANIDANQPAYAMGNYSPEFDLSQGIPSSEYITNMFLADRWYGSTNVYARTVAHEYTWNMTYTWQTDEGHYEDDVDENGNPTGTQTWVPDIVTHVSQPYSLPIGKAYVSFQFLADTQIYDFTNADIANGAYTGDHVYYDDTYEVPMECISTNEYKDIGTTGTIVSGTIDWNADTEKHVTFPENINYVSSRSVDSEADIAQAILNDTQAIRAQISNATKSRNDKLKIDGHTFLNNDWVTGCNFFDSAPASYRQCTESSGWKNDYLQQTDIKPLHAYNPTDVTGTKNIQIPSTVDNGYYSTTMDVYYQKLVPYVKTSSKFSD